MYFDDVTIFIKIIVLKFSNLTFITNICVRHCDSILVNKKNTFYVKFSYVNVKQQKKRTFRLKDKKDKSI